MVLNFTQQRCFSGMHSDLQPPNRLLFMTFPDKVTAGRLSRLAQDVNEAHELRGNPLRTERFHISLYHFRPDTFALREDLIAQVKRANLEVPIPPFEVVFDRLLSFSGNHGYVERDRSYALVLLPAKGATEVAALHKGLAVAVAKAGIKPTCWPQFNPHVTLLYARDHRIDELVKPIRWTVSNFVFMHSLVGRTQYRELGRWPLASRRPVQSVTTRLAKTDTAV